MLNMDEKNKLKSSRNVSTLKVDDDMTKLMMKIGILFIQKLFSFQDFFQETMLQKKLMFSVIEQGVIWLLSKDSWHKLVQKHQRTNRKYRNELWKIVLELFQEKKHQEELLLLLKEIGLSELVTMSEVDEEVKSFKNLSNETSFASSSFPEDRSSADVEKGEQTISEDVDDAVKFYVTNIAYSAILKEWQKVMLSLNDSNFTYNTSLSLGKTIFSLNTHEELPKLGSSLNNSISTVKMSLPQGYLRSSLKIHDVSSAILSDMMRDLSNDGFKDEGRLLSLVAKDNDNDLPVEKGPSITKICTNITLIEISNTDKLRETFNKLLSTGDVHIGHKLTIDTFDTKHMLKFVQEIDARAILVTKDTEQIMMSKDQPYLSNIINMGILSQENNILYRLSTYPLYIERNKSQIYCGYIHDITPMLSYEMKHLYLEESTIPKQSKQSILSKYINEINNENENPVCEDSTNDFQHELDTENKDDYDKTLFFKLQNVNRQRKKENMNRDNHKRIISFPKRFSSGLTYEQEIRNNMQIALEQVKANGFLHQEQGLHVPPHVVWPSGHALLQHKIRFIAMSLFSNEYIKRLHTFLLGRNRNGKVWPDNCIVRPEPLVNAGFSYCGVQSKVVCDQCGFESTTDDWSDDDDDYAISIHRQTQTECPFLKGNHETSPGTYERLSNNDGVALETTVNTNTTRRNDVRFRNNNNIVSILFVRAINGIVMSISDISVINNSIYRQPENNSVSETRTKINHDNKIDSETNNLIMNTNFAVPYAHSKEINTNYKVNYTSRSAYQLFSDQSSYGRIPHSLKTPSIMVSQENTFIPDVNVEDLVIYFRPDMESLETRIQTYFFLEKCDNDIHIYLAKNGFFFAGYRYGVICFSCGLSAAYLCQTEYKGLTIIHALIRPDCIYLQTSMDSKEMKHIRYQFFQEDDEKYPKYKHTYERIKSLTERCTFDNIVSEELAEAGFFLKAPYDNTIYCFQCGGGFHYTNVLHSIWRNHATWFPFCKFVKYKMGNEYIKHVLNTNMNQPENVQRGADMFLTDMVLSPKEGRLCVFCKHFPINTINLACGHKRSCKDCSIRIGYCDYCDTFIERIVDIDIKY
ncbi:uncharacterized protein LOC143048649 isoform X2 [Mytilus galloprovincialis]|uniref:uncharacterized protein LOC143048649 isoform X2 n=1 Tax=Mytilus galloprovincialis TaxID=29158 RepID=UPI003F7BA716